MKYCIIVMILSAIYDATLALQCYQCESISNPNCGEKFESEDRMKFDCSRVSPPRYLQSIFPSLQNATGCMKKVMEAGAGHSQIIRSCYFGDINNKQTGCQTDPSLPFIKQLSCDVCSDNLCNSTPYTGPVALPITIFFILSLYIFA